MQILYESHECMFLLDPEDTMEFYDAQRRANMAAKGEPSVEEQLVLKKLFCKKMYMERSQFLFLTRKTI